MPKSQFKFVDFLKWWTKGSARSNLITLIFFCGGDEEGILLKWLSSLVACPFIPWDAWRSWFRHRSHKSPQEFPSLLPAQRHFLISGLVPKSQAPWKGKWAMKEGWLDNTGDYTNQLYGDYDNSKDPLLKNQVLKSRLLWFVMLWWN